MVNPDNIPWFELKHIMNDIFGNKKIKNTIKHPIANKSKIFKKLYKETPNKKQKTDHKAKPKPKTQNF